jgi:lipooligosaccharide transport system permease protein
MTALAPSYDFFMYYFTLVITPMMMLSGVFFPVSQLPAALQSVAILLPLTHAIDLVRPLLNGTAPENVMLHVTVIVAYTLAGFYLSLVLFRNRLSR